MLWLIDVNGCRSRHMSYSESNVIKRNTYATNEVPYITQLPTQERNSSLPCYRDFKMLFGIEQVLCM